MSKYNKSGRVAMARQRAITIAPGGSVGRQLGLRGATGDWMHEIQPTDQRLYTVGRRVVGSASTVDSIQELDPLARIKTSGGLLVLNYTYGITRLNPNTSRTIARKLRAGVRTTTASKVIEAEQVNPSTHTGRAGGRAATMIGLTLGHSEALLREFAEVTEAAQKIRGIEIGLGNPTRLHIAVSYIAETESMLSVIRDTLPPIVTLAPLTALPLDIPAHQTPTA